MTHAALGPLFSSIRQVRSAHALLEFVVLGSGSSGNASLLRVTTPELRRQILIDAGLSPRMVRGQLSVLGFDLAETQEILFTHFDNDHAQAGWARVAMETGIRLRCARRHIRDALVRGYPDMNIDAFDARGEGFSLGPIDVQPCENPHDEGGTVAFRFETPAGTLGFATDIGRVSDRLVDTMRGVDILAIESNYDPQLQEASSRPRMLKDRIMGGKGHLSNRECIEAVRAIAWPDQPAHVVLLHLSRECNAPEIVRSAWQAELPTLAARLTLSEARTPTAPLRLRGGQLEMRAEDFNV